jgi:hypothetical protein
VYEYAENNSLANALLGKSNIEILLSKSANLNVLNLPL